LAIRRGQVLHVGADRIDLRGKGLGVGARATLGATGFGL
jgi:hypothetical protein